MNGAVSERVYLSKQHHHIINEECNWLVSGSIKVRGSVGCVGFCAKNKLLSGLKKSKWQNRTKYAWFKYRKNRGVHALIRITNSQIHGSRHNAAGSLHDAGSSARCWLRVTMQVSWSWAGTNHAGMSEWRQKGLRDGTNQRLLQKTAADYHPIPGQVVWADGSIHVMIWGPSHCWFDLKRGQETSHVVLKRI